MIRKSIKSIVFIFLTINGISQEISDKAGIKEKGGCYSIRISDQILEIDPKTGGRITSLKMDGKDFLTDKTVNGFNWGSTFWNSPQSDWDWPPSSEIDNKPYTVKVQDNELIMISQRDPRTGLVVTKRFSGNKKKTSYDLKYTITNRSGKTQKVAPWEITRVPTKGIAFFPMGDGERRGGLLPLTKVEKGICWFTYEENKLPTKGDRQLYADGAEGWLAEINDRDILVKKFPDIPLNKNAPKEGEVELYASPVVPRKSYVEIEHQGAYEELEPGNSLTWEVTWYLRKLPHNIIPEAGNILLTSYARELVK